MIDSKSWQNSKRKTAAAPWLGTVGYLALFLWSLALILLAPPPRMLLAGGLCLLAAALFYRQAFRRLMRPRWLLLLLLLGLPSFFFLGQRDLSLWGIALSQDGLAAGLQMMLRAAVIVAAADGFSGAVDVSQTAGLFERAGLKGLGFSLGVAMNLLPILRHSATTTWYSLRMRGGIRRRRWRSLRFLLVTVVSNALQRAEEIALAAEARAFSPECSQAPPLKSGRLDWVIVLGNLASFVALTLLPW